MVVGAPVMAAFARRWPPRLTLIICLLVFRGKPRHRSDDASVLSPPHHPGAQRSRERRIPRRSTEHGHYPRAIEPEGACTVDPALRHDDRNRRGRPSGALLGTAMGWRTTFWAIAILCIPAAVGVIRGVTNNVGRAMTGATSPRLRVELSQLATPRLILAMALGALINGGNFAAFTFLAPIVTETAGLAEAWVSVALVMFGVGSFLGVTIAGRLSDQRPGLMLAVGGPLLLAGWIVLAVVASHPAATHRSDLRSGSPVVRCRQYFDHACAVRSLGCANDGRFVRNRSIEYRSCRGARAWCVGLATGLGLLAPVWVASVLTAIALVLTLLAGRALTKTTAVAN